MSVKDFLPIDGFDIAKDIHVRCKNCRRLHTFEKEECGSDTWSEEADMGTRTEYTFIFDDGALIFSINPKGIFLPSNCLAIDSKYSQRLLCLLYMLTVA